MSIFVTGDWHGIDGMSRISYKKWSKSKELIGENYLIVLGDFGLIWGDETNKQVKYLTNWLEDKNFKILFVAGNHENYDLLNQYPTKSWKNGEVGVISDQILWLKTGNIFIVENQTLAVFGGALSIDKHWRTEGVSWWKEEIPSNEAMESFVELVEQSKWNVDYLLTHTTSTKDASLLCRLDKVDNVSNFLQFIKDRLNFKHHYFGHFHRDVEVSESSTCVYQKVIELKK